MYVLSSCLRDVEYLRLQFLVIAIRCGRCISHTFVTQLRIEQRKTLGGS